jgi:hypothetical protein
MVFPTLIINKKTYGRHCACTKPTPPVVCMLNAMQDAVPANILPWRTSWNYVASAATVLFGQETGESTTKRQMSSHFRTLGIIK